MVARVRVFDPAALREYQQFLRGLLDELEQDVIPALRDGTLRKAPAFGWSPGAKQGAAVNYREFHETTWRNLQYLRGTLHGMIAELERAIEDGGTTEDDVVREFGVPVELPEREWRTGNG
jgi:hypothetical protein